MSRRILVAIGAGAAHDLIPASGGKAQGSSVEALRPPLANDVFADTPETKAILDKYQGARTLAGKIRLELLNGQPLEPLLKELSEVTAGPVARQFPQVPLYLQDLFTDISKRYTNQPTNYQVLVHDLFQADFEEIAFLTLNYDTLLDDVLDTFYLNGPIRTLDSYIGRRTLLVKLHGSINWARAIEYRGDESRDEATYLETLARLGNAGLRGALGPIELVGHQRWSADQRFMYYPALSAPLGQYNINDACPHEHLNALRRFLPQCSNVLVIGVSGKDDDLLDLVGKSLSQSIKCFVVVDVSKQAAEDALRRFGRVPQTAHVHPLLYSDGFSTFIVSGGVKEVIERCG